MMPREVSRATISSLKATHQAHRIASEILHPHIPTPTNPPQPLPDPDFKLEPLVRTRRTIVEGLNITDESILKSLAVIVATAVLLILFHWATQHS
ncbi:hypothetical protein BH10PLA1_BH10PLA1_08960 [soil metagenome]